MIFLHDTYDSSKYFVYKSIEIRLSKIQSLLKYLT